MNRRTALLYWSLVGLVTCGCRTPSQFGPPTQYGAMPPAAACPMPMTMGPARDGRPLAVAGAGARLPDLQQPWPRDEYLYDGGDTELGVRVAPDWRMYGLDPTDTVAHFDTLDGRTLVEPSNRVAVYAPRFGAVRVVSRIALGEQIESTDGIGAPQSLARFEELGTPRSSLQQDQPLAGVGRSLVEAYITDDGDGLISGATLLGGLQDSPLPYEDLQIIQSGIHDQADTALLDNHIDAAIAWSKDDAVGVMLDKQWAAPLTKDTRGQVIYTVEDRRDNPKLRVIKVASTSSAKSGDYVDFTIRFDNIGDQPLGNIVLVDNLTTRLEYVPDSGQASVAVEASQKPNAGESLELRWQVLDPLQSGEGGVIRFRCRVR